MNFGAKLKSLLLPAPPIFGLSFSDLEIALTIIDRASYKAKKSRRLRLPPTIISGGVIQEKHLLVGAVKALKNLSGIPPETKIRVIISISPQISFSTNSEYDPNASEDLSDALSLIADVESPIKLKDGYYDWQQIGFDSKSGKDLYLFSIAPAKVIDEYFWVCEQAECAIYSIETWGMSLARAAVQKGYLDKNDDYLIVYSDVNNALTLASIRKREFFSELFLQMEKSIPIEEYEKILDATRRYIDYHKSETKNDFRAIIIFYPDHYLMEELQKRFGIRVLAIFDSLHADLDMISFGAALRGINAQSIQQEISLTPPRIKNAYQTEKRAYLFSIWLESGLIFSIFLLIMFGLSFGFMNMMKKVVANRLTFNEELKTRYGDFAKKAEIFNKKAGVIQNLANIPSINIHNAGKIFPFIPSNFTTQDVSMRDDGTIILSIFAPSREEIFKFRDALAQNPIFQNVDLQTNAIVESAKGFQFNMSMQISDLR